MTNRHKSTQDNQNKDIIHRILTSIAYREQCEPIDLSPPLYEVVDPDALVQVVQGDGVDTITFTYRGYDIVVGGDGRVQVS